MENCIFTICAKNYIGLALVLEKSIKQHNQGYSFYIFVADELPPDDRASLPNNVIEARMALNDLIPSELLEEMAFKYNLTEFCTSIKPFCFQYLFNDLKQDKAIYLDPDILTFSSFEPLFIQLETVNIILTPHVTTFNKEYNGERPEKGLLSTGVYNLGFLALKNDDASLKMLIWWGERLKNQCYIDALDSYFTDQRWMDFLPCFFDTNELLISKHLGLNVAPWNFFEREVFKENENWMVKNRQESNEKRFPLVFVHFSGYDYKSLIQRKVVQNNIQNLGAYPDIAEVCSVYADFLIAEVETFNLYIKYSYTYGTFDNGIEITNFQRRIFRGLIEENNVISKPFSTKRNSFYEILANKGLLFKSSTDNIDKLNKLNMPDSSRKLKKINTLMRIMFKLIGLKNYILLLRLMRPYSRIENQLHLVDKSYGGKLR